MKTPNPGNRQLLLLAVLAICAAAIAGCGGGATTTVTVTAPAAGSPPAGATPSKGGKEEVQKTVTEEAGAVAGYVDNVVSESGSLTLFGWAAAPDLSAPATKVTATVGGKAVAEAVPALERVDVVEALGKPGLKDSGFELHLPSEALDCGAPASGIKVAAEFEGRSGPIEFGEGIKPKLSEAC
jgi:hypothetical protein